LLEGARVGEGRALTSEPSLETPPLGPNRKMVNRGRGGLDPLPHPRHRECPGGRGGRGRWGGGWGHAPTTTSTQPIILSACIIVLVSVGKPVVRGWDVGLPPAGGGANSPDEVAKTDVCGSVKDRQSPLLDPEPWDTKMRSLRGQGEQRVGANTQGEWRHHEKHKKKAQGGSTKGGSRPVQLLQTRTNNAEQSGRRRRGIH